VNALHEQFVAEARELIQQANDDLVAAEREGLSEVRIDRVFRVFHTLKGSAAVVDLPAMGLVMHAAEDVLTAIQAGRLGATPLVIDHALACLDQVATWVDEFEAHEALPAGSSEAARKLAENLRSLIQVQASTQPATRPTAVWDGDEIPAWVRSLLAAPDMPKPEPESRFIAFCYEPDPGCFFDGHDPLDVVRHVPGLRLFRMEAREALPPLADLDPYSCNLRLSGICTATPDELAAVFRLLPDQVRTFEIPNDASHAAKDGASVDDAAALIRAVLEEQVLVLRTAGNREHAGGRIGSAMRAAVGALRHGRRGSLAESIGRAGALALSQSGPAALVAAIEDALRSLAGFASSGGGKGEAQASPAQPARSASRSLRVDESRIDALVNMAGELLVVKNSFAHLARRAEGETAGHDLARAIRDQNEALERLAGVLHGAVLQLRMVTLAQVFRSFPRLVRDLSQQLGKEVALVTRGETTEADKTIVDLLFEPLMHLVRNAVDHGIETAADRRAAGKSQTATLALQATRRADRLIVEVIDDGRGIGEKGLLPPDELAALSDEQAVDLIFAAGLSTAAEISDVSGRGVGMDVVRATIERVGGRVSVASRVGAGTTVSLDLPMNIALMRIMVVESGGQVFGIPMDAVSQTVRLTPDRISRFKNNDGFVFHDHVVPICSLAELMNLPVRAAADGKVRLVVVAEVGGRTTALEVDGIRDRLEVVLKPMQGLLSNARGYAGTTLLGDGAVLLVLDLKEILP
jgi:two-component system chemotaxis sensor kinase CheA